MYSYDPYDRDCRRRRRHHGAPDNHCRRARLVGDARAFYASRAMVVAARVGRIGERRMDCACPGRGNRCRTRCASTARPLEMLQLRPNCECCNRDLPPESVDARICSFECTFCARCAETVLGGTCPNCGGELVARPRRRGSTLAKYPASVERVVKPEGCDHV